jgi:hypothetical protein
MQLAWRANSKRALEDELCVPEGEIDVVQCRRSGKWGTRVACLSSSIDDVAPALFSPGSSTRIELRCVDAESKRTPLYA